MTVAGPMKYDAVLVAGFGGPDGPDDVMPFLRNVTRGRGVPDERLAHVAEHYLALGGASPINAQNRALVEALGQELSRRGLDVPVLWGNRNWQPYLADTVTGALEVGHTRLLGLATSAYSSYSSCRQYREDFASALIGAGAVGRVRIDKVRPYFDMAGFVGPFAEGLAEAMRAARAAGLDTGGVQVVFTTHSIPDSMADASGIAGDGRLYVRQHEAVCAEVVRRAGLLLDATGDRGADPISWQFAYQSRSGSPAVPWLGPDIGEVVDELADAGDTGVIVVPIGFISDHVEVIWDLDTEAAQAAKERGLWFARVPTPGVHPDFVSGLADLVAARLTGTPEPTGETDCGRSLFDPPLRRPDSCPPGCCSARRVQPTTAGDDSADDWRGVDVAAMALAASGIGAMPA